MKQTLTTPNTLPSQPVAALLLTAVFLWTAGTGRGEARHHPICSPRPPLSPEYERAGETSRLPFPSPGGGLVVGPKWKGTTGRMKNLTPACSRASGESGCGPRPGRRWRKNQSPR